MVTAGQDMALWEGKFTVPHDRDGTAVLHSITVQLISNF